MTKTESKLNEAKYFLDLLKKNSTKANEFDYILNAFINSARAVTWVMKAEFSHNAEWVKWFKEKKATIEEEKLLKTFNELRNDSTKRNVTVKTNPFITLNIPSKLVESGNFDKLTEGENCDITIQEGKIQIISQNSEFLEADISNIEYIGRKISHLSETVSLNECKKYFAFLKNLTKECLNKFVI